MDALDFLKTYHRMCDSYEDCHKCPLRGCSDIGDWSNKIAAKNIPLVEQWGKDNPIKTRQTAFLENYPNALLDCDGYLNICPQEIEKDTPCPYKSALGEAFYGCAECHRNYWGKENA